jgi:Phage integrase family
MAGLAARHDALEHNPVRDAGRISPGRPKRVPRALSVAETRELRARLSNDDKARERDLPDLVDMLLATGLRVGEGGGDVGCRGSSGGHSRSAGHRDSSEGAGTRDQARTKDQGRIPYARASVMGCGHAETATSGQAGSNGVCSVLGGLRDRDNVIGDLRNALNAAGFEWVTSHTFRRTVATLMDQSGLSARAAADQLGHSHPSLTQDVSYRRRIASTGAAEVLEVLG